VWGEERRKLEVLLWTCNSEKKSLLEALGAKTPRRNNVLKVQGLAALEYLKFTTFEALAAGPPVVPTAWKNALNCDSEGAAAGGR
jgi:hypothetical protein